MFAQDTFVTNFDAAKLVHYYEAIKRDRQYNPPYTLSIHQKSENAGLRQDGILPHPREGLHSLHVTPANANLGRFWMTFRELEDEANGFMKRTQ